MELRQTAGGDSGGYTAMLSGGNDMPGLKFVRRHLAKRHSFLACCKDQRMEAVPAAGMAAAAVVDGGAGRYPVGVGVVDRDLAADKGLVAGNDLCSCRCSWKVFASPIYSGHGSS